MLGSGETSVWFCSDVSTGNIVRRHGSNKPRYNEDAPRFEVWPCHPTLANASHFRISPGVSYISIRNLPSLGRHPNVPRPCR